MYRVIQKFADMKDNMYVYNIGDEYPREGHSVTDERIEFLLSNQNRLKTPVIELVAEETVAEPIKEEAVTEEDVPKKETVKKSKKSK